MLRDGTLGDRADGSLPRIPRSVYRSKAGQSEKNGRILSKGDNIHHLNKISAQSGAKWDENFK